MEEPHHFSGASSGGGGKPPRRPQHKKELPLQGPRPTPLRVSQDSHKIKKPQNHHHLPPPYPARLGLHQPDQLQPVIIYSVSPKVIHAEESDFMSIVQRLTGISPTPGDVSPAARLASIERTSPTERGPSAASFGVQSEDILDIMEGLEFDLDQFPGILSPAPSSLPPVPRGFFSPAMEMENMSFLQDLSPFWHGSNSPSSSSALFSAPIISPSPSLSVDLFDLFLHF